LENPPFINFLTYYNLILNLSRQILFVKWWRFVAQAAVIAIISYRKFVKNNKGIYSYVLSCKLLVCIPSVNQYMGASVLSGFKKSIISICILSLISSPLMAFKMPSIESKPRVIGGTALAGISAFALFCSWAASWGVREVQKQYKPEQPHSGLLGEAANKKISELRSPEDIKQMALELGMTAEEVAELTYYQVMQKWVNSPMLNATKKTGDIGLGVSSTAMIASIALIVSGLK
jgi:hypothetical protein